MAARRKRPTPPARMVELLTEAKARLLAEGVTLTVEVFDREWDAAWRLMVTERAWPHATEHRRQWRAAMRDTRSEFQAAFLGVETAYSTWQDEVLRGIEGPSWRDDDPDLLVGYAVA